MKLTKLICEVSDITLSSIASCVLCKDANNVGNTVFCVMGGYACVRSTIRTISWYVLVTNMGCWQYYKIFSSWETMTWRSFNNDTNCCKCLEGLNSNALIHADYKTFATTQNITYIYSHKSDEKSYHTVVTSCVYRQSWHRSHAQTPPGSPSWISCARQHLCLGNKTTQCFKNFGTYPWKQYDTWLELYNCLQL